MESTHHVTVPLRAGKKMKKRKELDALVAHSGPGKRLGGGSGGGSSPQDQLLSESTDEHDDYWSGKDRGSGGSSGGGGGPRCRLLYRRRLFGSLLRACTAFLVFACVVATTTVMWLFIDIREQVTSLRNELDQGAVYYVASRFRSFYVVSLLFLFLCYSATMYAPEVAHNVVLSSVFVWPHTVFLRPILTCYV